MTLFIGEVTADPLVAEVVADVMPEESAAGVVLPPVVAVPAAGGTLFVLDGPPEPLLGAPGLATEVTILLTPDVRPVDVPTPRADALPEPKSRTKATAETPAKKPKVKTMRE